MLWPPDVKSQLVGKDPEFGERLRPGVGATEDEMSGWLISDSIDMSLSILREIVKPGMLQSMGSQRVGHDWLNWNKKKKENTNWKKHKQTLHYNPMFIKYQTGQAEKTCHTWINGCAVAIVESLGHARLSYNPMDCSLPGTSDHGIFQAGIVEWIAISFSRGSSQPRDRTCISCTGRQILYHWATREARHQS